MSQQAMFPASEPSDSPVGTETVFSVGDVFVFAGLRGQDPSEDRLPGSGSVGWFVEVVGVSPWGALGVLCAATRAGLSDGYVAAVGYADAVALVRAQVWVRD